MDAAENDMVNARARAETAQLTPYFRVADELYVGADPIPLRHDGDSPPVLRDRTVYRASYPATLQQLAGFVTQTHGVATNVTQDAIDAASKASQDGRQALLEQARSRGEAVVAAAQSSATAASGGWIQIQYDGPLSGFLDQITARTGTAWRFADGKVTIFFLDTRTYRIASFGGSTSLTSTISNEAGAGSGNGAGGSSASGTGGGSKLSPQSGQTTKLTTEVDVFAAARDTVQAMLSPSGKMASAPSGGTITVTDNVAVLDRIGHVIDELNQRMTQQVRIDTKVFTLELTDAESYGIDWSGVWESVASKYGVTASSFGNVDPLQAAQVSVSVLDPQNRFSGSNVVLSALAQQGKLATVTSSANVTLSSRPVPVQVTRETGYIDSIQTSLVANAGAQTTVTTSSVTTGFAMQLLPVVLDGADVLMQAQVTLSNLRDLRRIQVGQNAVERPEVDARQFLQQVKMKSGSTLVLAGFEADVLQGAHKGVLPATILTGGSRSTSKSRSVLVILITPVIID
jgi:type IVB pilus formation R64 PilN family outer membrane protein